MKKVRKPSKKQEITVWDKDDPVEKVMRVVAVVILLSIAGFLIGSFAFM